MYTSDDTYNEVGASSNLTAFDYGVNLGFWDDISGIQLDIERRSGLGADNLLIERWADG
ncbi:MAG: hypothetical protein AB8B56_03290 [Crocinitomicaceae bacterium]